MGRVDPTQQSSARLSYSAYGLRIDTSLDFTPILSASVPCEQEPAIPRISIEVGEVPTRLPGAVYSRGRIQASATSCLITIRDVGHFLVRDGSSIVCEPDRNATSDLLRVYLLGTAMAALLLQRGDLPLHGSCVSRAGKAVLILGQSGAGKSTLAVSLAREGFLFVADDVSVLRSGSLNVQPGTSTAKLWPDSVTALRIAGDDLFAFSASTSKRAIVPRSSTVSPVPLTAVYVLEQGDVIRPQISPLTSPETAMLLVRHTFRGRLVAGMGRQAAHLAHVATAAATLRARRIVRPASRFMLQELVDLVVRDLATSTE